MDNTKVYIELRKYIDSLQISKPVDKKLQRVIIGLSSIKEDDLLPGNRPNYFFAHVECNSTAVGSSYYNGTETRRTVSRDYVTPEYLFIDGHEKTCKKGLELFYLKKGQSITYHHKKDILKVANYFGTMLHKQDFHDLNFTLSSHRINRHEIHISEGPFSFPIRPIFAQIKKTEEKIFIGYVYEYHGNEHIIIDPEKTAFKRKGILDRKFFNVLLWIIFPPLAIFLAIINLFNDN